MIRCQLQKQLQAATGELDFRIELEVRPGQLLAIYGPSGAGKTSTLRMLAGLLRPDAGRIAVHDEVWLDTAAGVDWPPRQRNIGFVFQDYGLFPNMTVLENLQFALPSGGDARIVDRLIEAVELGNLRKQRPGLLSGGQQQRVALARALVRQPRLLLLDEPLSALDEEMRHKLQRHLLQVHREFSLTTILVSHSRAEVSKLADRVVVLRDGVVSQSGTPGEIFEGAEGSAPSPDGHPGKILALERRGTETFLRVAVPTDRANDLRAGDEIVWRPE